MVARRSSARTSNHRLARIDSRAVFDFAEELRELLEVEEEDLDPDMVLPVCKEIQGRVQAIASRIEQFVQLEPGR